jgi:hypothetical protein
MATLSVPHRKEVARGTLRSLVRAAGLNCQEIAPFNPGVNCVVVIANPGRARWPPSNEEEAAAVVRNAAVWVGFPPRVFGGLVTHPSDYRQTQ